MIKLKAKDVAAVRAELLERQGGVCAICKKPPVIPCLDHFHGTTGHIRGVLCSGCNAFEGRVAKWQHMCKVTDLPTWLENLAAYLRVHETSQHGLVHPTHKTADEKKTLAKKRRARKLKS